MDEHSNILQYADDLVIFAGSKSVELAALSVQRTVSRVSGYLSERGLDIAPNKLQIIIFNRRRSGFANPPDIVCDGQPIPVVREARFLGVWLDEGLNGHRHLLNSQV